MRVVGVTMVRDEADIIDRTIAHMLAEGADELIVADNLSTDGTSEILAELARTEPVTVIRDEEPAYFQDRKMTRLAWTAALYHGADWIVPFDADEFWCASDPAMGSLRDALEGVGERAEVLHAQTFHHPPSADPHLRQAEAAPRSKVCFRWEPGAWILMGNHDIVHNGNRLEDVITIHEFQYRSFEQFKRKVRNGAAAVERAGLPEVICSHWRRLGAMDDAGLRAEWDAMNHPPELVHDRWEPSA